MLWCQALTLDQVSVHDERLILGIFSVQTVVPYKLCYSFLYFDLNIEV